MGDYRGCCLLAEKFCFSLSLLVNFEQNASSCFRKIILLKELRNYTLRSSFFTIVIYVSQYIACIVSKSYWWKLIFRLSVFYLFSVCYEFWISLFCSIDKICIIIVDTSTIWACAILQYQNHVVKTQGFFDTQDTLTKRFWAF